MTPAPEAAAGERQRPCARCIIGALLGTVVAAGMLFITVRIVSAVARGQVRLRRG